MQMLISKYLSRIERLLEDIAESDENAIIEDICTKDRHKQVIAVLNAIGNCLMSEEIRDKAGSEAAAIFSDYIEFLQMYH